MSSVQLVEIAQARSGDKGNTVNIGLIAKEEGAYSYLVDQVTSDKVKEHLTGLVNGTVTRYELPNIGALNFVCTEALAGGGSNSVRLDNLGKCFAANLLRMTIDIPENEKM